jgi:hypothetical protein
MRELRCVPAVWRAPLAIANFIVKNCFCFDSSKRMMKGRVARHKKESTLDGLRHEGLQMSQLTWLETAAFTVLIAGQFLAALFVVSRRQRLYPDPRQPADRAVHSGLPARHPGPGQLGEAAKLPRAI